MWGPGGRRGLIGFGIAQGPEAFSARSYLGVTLASQLSFNRHCSLVGEISAGQIHLSRREIEILH